MKYAVIAALLATNTQALTGCKKGIGAKVYSDSKCKEEAHVTHKMLEEDIANTGKCVSHVATDDDKKALTFAKTTHADKEATAVKALKAYQRSTALDVDKVDGSGKTTVEDKYAKDYAAIKKAYVTKEKSV